MKQNVKLKEVRDILLYILIGSAFLIGRIYIAARQPHLFSAKPAAHLVKSEIPVKWQFAARGAITGSLALGEDGTLYAASELGSVYALDATGKLRWTFDAGSMFAGPTVGVDGSIYVTNRDQHIFAINRAGELQWTVGGDPYAGRPMGRTAAAIDQNFLYTPWHGTLRTIRLSTGTLESSADMGFGFERGASVGILPDGRIVHSGVFASDRSGITVWQNPLVDPPLNTYSLIDLTNHLPLNDSGMGSGIAVAVGGTFYATFHDFGLAAFTPGGTFLWSFKTKLDSINSANPVIAADGTIYFAAGDGNLNALNIDGTQKWAVATGICDSPLRRGSGIATSTPMLAEDGTIYLANCTALIAVSPEGKVLATVPIAGSVVSSPTLAPDGTVYVASQGGAIIAFAGTHGGLMNSPWPKFQRDLANSGRALPF